MYEMGAIVPDVEKVLQEVMAEAEGMAIMRGQLTGGGPEVPGVSIIRWHADEKNNWREFFEYARALGVKAMVYDTLTIDMEMLRAESEWLRDEENPDVNEQLESMMDELDPHDGELGQIGLLFQYGNMLYAADISTAPFTKYALALGLARSFDEMDDLDEEDRYDIQ